MEVRIGQLLLSSGVLSQSQVDEILETQRRTGRPFGLIGEELFDLDPGEVESAWAYQYARLTRHIDPDVEVFDAAALELVTRRQAWQFRSLPVRFDGAELMIATTERYLRRALGFATMVIGVPTFLVVAAPPPLGEALCRHYPLAGMSPLSVTDDSMDRLLRRVA